MEKGRTLEGESRYYDREIFDWSKRRSAKADSRIRRKKKPRSSSAGAKRDEITYGFGFEISHRGGKRPFGHHRGARWTSGASWRATYSTELNPRSPSPRGRSNSTPPICAAWGKLPALRFAPRLDQRVSRPMRSLTSRVSMSSPYGFP